MQRLKSLATVLRSALDEYDPVLPSSSPATPQSIVLRNDRLILEFYVRSIATILVVAGLVKERGLDEAKAKVCMSEKESVRVSKQQVSIINRLTLCCPSCSFVT